MTFLYYSCWLAGGYLAYKWLSSFFSVDAMEEALKKRIKEEEKKLKEFDEELHELDHNEHSARKAVSCYEDELKRIEKLDIIESNITVFCKSCVSGILKMEVFEKKEDGIFIDDLYLKVEESISLDAPTCYRCFYMSREYDFYLHPAISYSLLELIVTNVLSSYHVIAKNELVVLEPTPIKWTGIQTYDLDVIKGPNSRVAIPIHEVKSFPVIIS